MSELRYNRITREWVILATERAKRPEDFVKKKMEKKEIPAYKPDCPFCLGNENQTPPETFRIGEEKNWKIRVAPNKFPALSPKEELVCKKDSIYPTVSGYGIHEVIVEHPNHNAFIALMTDAEVENIVQTYHDRYLWIQKQKGIEAIIIFKNHGATAGTSLEHQHSQIIATPIIPPQLRDRLEGVREFYKSKGCCIFCYVLEAEHKQEKRIVLETSHFVSLVPYAALSPFHLWIFPRRHMSSFGEINQEEIKDLARHLKGVVGKLYHGLDNPDFNYTIRSIPIHDKDTQSFHWYISVIPRVSQMAGFELGSGIFINIALPEKSAEFLRNISV